MLPYNILPLTKNWRQKEKKKKCVCVWWGAGGGGEEEKRLASLPKQLDYNQGVSLGEALNNNARVYISTPHSSSVTKTRQTA